MQDMINNLSIAEKIELYNCLYEDLAGKGIEGDTQLAHVNVEEMAVLRAMGGSGTINPHTNLIQFGGGGGSPPPPPPATSTVTQQATIPDELKPFVTDVLEKAQAIQERREEEGYVPFSGPRIAQFAPEQTQAFEQIKGLVGTGQQYFDPAARLTASSAFAPTGPQVGQFMNPYIQNVIDIQQREARRAADIDRQQLGAQAVGAGAFGGSRQAILEAEQSRNLQQQLGDIQARGLAAAYEDAQTRLQQQRERERLAGAQFASLGQAAPGQAFRELSALEAIGAQRQQQAQQALDIAQQEYEIARTFPERTLQDYQSIIRGYAAPIPASTVQRSQVTKPAPSFLQQAAGLGLATAGVGKAFGGFKEGGLVSLANGGRPLTEFSDSELNDPELLKNPNYKISEIQQEKRRRVKRVSPSPILPDKLELDRASALTPMQIMRLRNERRAAVTGIDSPRGSLSPLMSVDQFGIGRISPRDVPSSRVLRETGIPAASKATISPELLTPTVQRQPDRQVITDAQLKAIEEEKKLRASQQDLMSDTFIKRGLTDVPQAGPMKGQVTDQETSEQGAERIRAGSATPIEIEQIKQMNEEAAAERMREQAAAGADMDITKRTLTPREELLAGMLPDPQGRTNVMDDSPISLEETEAIGNLTPDILPDAAEVATQVNEAAQNASDVAAAANSNISGLAANVKKDIAEGNTNSANVQFMNELSDIKSRLSDSYGKEREALMKQLETKDRGTGLALIELGGAILAQDGGQTLMQVLGKGLKDSKFTTKIANLDDRQKKLALGIARLDRQELQSEFNLTKAQADAVLASRKLDIQSRLATTKEEEARIKKQKNLMTFNAKYGAIDLNKEVGAARAKDLMKDAFTDIGGFSPEMKAAFARKGYTEDQYLNFSNNELKDVVGNKAKQQIFANSFNKFLTQTGDPNLAMQGALISTINSLQPRGKQ